MDPYFPRTFPLSSKHVRFLLTVLDYLLVLLADPEVIDNHCQDKIKLQPNGNWCIKSYTIDGKPVWIGNYQTKELALNSYAVVNMLTCPKVKVGPHINHPSCPGLRSVPGSNSLHLHTHARTNDIKINIFMYRR